MNLRDRQFHWNMPAGWRRVVALSALCAACAWSLPSQGAMIVLKDSVEVSTAVVLLGQVAEIHDADAELVQRLAGVMLFPTPAAGRSKAVDFETIRGRLASQGFNLTELEFSGSSLLTVSGARFGDGSIPAASAAATELSQKRADDMVTSGVRAYLKEKAASLGNIQVELKLTPKQVSLLTAAASARVEISGGNEPWTGHQSFRAGFYDRPGHLVALLIDCRVTPLPQVLVASANLPKGHVVSAEDVSWKQQPAVKPAGAFLDREELVVGQETKRNLRAGEPIASVDIRGVPLVRRGDIVTVIARGHGIVVRTDAKALADGSLGQPIKLVSLDGRRELNAYVSGYHEASVGPSSGDGAALPGNGTGIRLVTVESGNQRVSSNRPERTVAAEKSYGPRTGPASPSPNRVNQGGK
jgi:flagella basal body P-ring formation protein FlgA